MEPVKEERKKQTVTRMQYAIQVNTDRSQQTGSTSRGKCSSTALDFGDKRTRGITEKYKTEVLEIVLPLQCSGKCSGKCSSTALAFGVCMY